MRQDNSLSDKKSASHCSKASACESVGASRYLRPVSTAPHCPHVRPYRPGTTLPVHPKPISQPPFFPGLKAGVSRRNSDDATFLSACGLVFGAWSQGVGLCGSTDPGGAAKGIESIFGCQKWCVWPVGADEDISARSMVVSAPVFL